MKTIKKYPLVLFVLFAFVLAACGGDIDQTVEEVTEAVEEVVEDSSEEVQQAVEEVTEAVEEVVEEVAEEVDEAMAEDGEEMIQVCEVTDVGGIDDKSFNATAWAGLERAGEELGIGVKFLESAQQSDYETNINALVEDGCDLIVTVGFLLGDATATGAAANPDTNFAIIDFAYDPPIDNVVGLIYQIDQAAFLAGYVAASATETGIVGTFGGINIPPVTQFMDGYVLGVDYYNAQNGTDVQVLGWDIEAQDGLFTGNFDSTDDGRSFGESLMDEGADIILPVAGPVGLGTAAAAQERGAWIVGVDTDWTVSAPEFADVVLTSILKRMDNSVYDQAQAMVDGTWTGGGVAVGTLENGGVGISAPVVDVPGLADVEAGIIDGSIPTMPGAAPAEEAAAPSTDVKVCEVTDVGGIDDKSFNATAWAGLERAGEDLGIEVKFLESAQQSDYETNINALVDDGCGLIVTVGFLLGDATAAGAAAYPDTNFAIIDFAYDPPIDNVVGLIYQIDQAAFLAGYVAASATETGIVGTFGGINIPPVTQFMDGYVLGVDYYNAENGTDVQVLGWDIEAQDGLFTGNFDSTDDGRSFGESLMDEGADIILPVAGPVGLGTAAAAQERGAWIVGVDTDWTVSAPEFGDVVLTSILKRMDNSVYDQAQAMVDGTWTGGGVAVGTLENGGVGISAPVVDVPGLADVEAGIIDGSIPTSP